MKIRFRYCGASPAYKLRWFANQIQNVPIELARQLVPDNAEALEEMPLDNAVETAALVQPITETASIKRGKRVKRQPINAE